MSIKKAFRIKSEIINFDDVASLLTYLDLNKNDLLLTERRIFDKYLENKVKDARVIIRDDYISHGPNSEELIEKVAAESGAQCSRVIGIGGGAVLDLAKLLALETAVPVKNLFAQNIQLHKARELILIPTTPGTGSEVTQFCAVYVPDLGAQFILDDELLCADKAILCPEFLSGIPLKVLAASSFDAFVHAFESYLSPLATPFSQALAKDAMQKILEVWKDVTSLGASDLEKSYKQLQTAGTLSGLSYANAGCAAVHALSYPLSIRLKIPHGEANYLVFNEVLKIYAAKNPTGALGDIEEIIAATLNCTKENALIKSDNLCGTLMQRKPLSSYGMKENQILEFTDMVLTRQHMLIANGYVQLTVGEIAKIYKDLL